jgi:hypothetical protein
MLPEPNAFWPRLIGRSAKHWTTCDRLWGDNPRQTKTMTVSIELEPTVEKLLRTVAKERGVSLEELLADRINLRFSEEEIEELEDERDNAEAERRMANSDPSERKTLDDWRKALGR